MLYHATIPELDFLFNGADDFRETGHDLMPSTPRLTLTPLLAAPRGFSRFFGPRAVPRSPAPTLYHAMVTSVLHPLPRPVGARVYPPGWSLSRVSVFAVVPSCFSAWPPPLLRPRWRERKKKRKTNNKTKSGWVPSASPASSRLSFCLHNQL